MRAIVLHDLMAAAPGDRLTVHAVAGQSDFSPARCGFTAGEKMWAPVDTRSTLSLTDCPGCFPPGPERRSR